MLGDRNGSHKRDSRQHTNDQGNEGYPPEHVPEVGSGYRPGNTAFIQVPATADEDGPSATRSQSGNTGVSRSATGAFDFMPEPAEAAALPGQHEDDVLDGIVHQPVGRHEADRDEPDGREGGYGHPGEVDVASVFDDEPAPATADRPAYEPRPASVGRHRREPAAETAAETAATWQGPSGSDDADDTGAPGGAETLTMARGRHGRDTDEPGSASGPDAEPLTTAPRVDAGDYADLPQVHLAGPGGDACEPGTEDGVRRARRGRAVKFGAVAAALVVLAGGTAGAMALTSGSDDPNEGRILAAPPPADPVRTAEQRKAAETQRRKALRDEAARAGRNAFRDRPDLSVKAKPKPKPKPAEVAAPGPTGPVVSGSPRAIAKKMLPDYGWSVSSEFGCLDRLWQKESGWNPRAANPSGAYGIPQALPGSKMASAGSDWETNPATQIEWGLDYIKGRYSSPCDAYSHSESVGWY